jgi:DNA-binding response OmpR family regulator
VRPFSYEELLARIRAVLGARRLRPTSASRGRDHGRPRDADGDGRRTSGPAAGKEYELLLKLLSDPTRVFTKEQLLRDVWAFAPSGERGRSTRMHRDSGASSRPRAPERLS